MHDLTEPLAVGLNSAGPLDFETLKHKLEDLPFPTRQARNLQAAAVTRSLHASREAAREKALVDARAAHRQEVDRLKCDADDWNAQVDQFAHDYGEGKPAFQKSAKTAYVPDSKIGEGEIA